MSLKLIAGITYENNIYPDLLISSLVHELRRQRKRLAGVMQHSRWREGASRCDMDLEELASGRIFNITQDRGKAAKGCRLDTSVLIDVAAAIQQSIANSPDLLLINKFGREEAEGRGLRDAIGEALGFGIPVIVCVPARNLDAWRAFSDGFAIDMMPKEAEIFSWLIQHRLIDSADIQLPWRLSSIEAHLVQGSHRRA